MRRKVAVIGAGAAGLVAVRELLREDHDVVCYEVASGVGGLWAYSDEVESDLLGTDPGRLRVHSSIYAGLRTNLPREIMGYQDFPCIPEAMQGRSVDPRRYPGHAELLAYFQCFADEFDLRKHICFRTRVVSATQLATGEHAPEASRAEASRAANSAEETPRWRLTTATACPECSTDHDSAQTAEYDAVVCCVGCYTEPNLPQVKGMELSPAQQMHCHNYRTPDRFRHQTVLVVGASFSGDEICRHIANVADKVYHSARTWPTPAAQQDDMSTIRAPTNIIRSAMISELCADGTAVFEDGRSSAVLHSIVFCTGYQYRYKFLKAPDLVCTDDMHVAPLYKHVFVPATAASLAFVGLPWKCLRNVQFELQAKWVARVLSGRVILPSYEAMLADVQRLERLYLEHKVPLRYLHNQSDAMPENQWVYDDWLAESCGANVTPVSTWRRQLSKVQQGAIFHHAEDFRDAERPAEEPLLAIGRRELLDIVEHHARTGQWRYPDPAASVL